MKFTRAARVTAVLIVIGLAALSGAGLALGYWGPIGSIKLAETPPRAAPSQDRRIDGVEITAYVTGWVRAPASILIDQNDPRTPDRLSSPQWVPSLAYAVRHPRHGVAVLDTGLRAGSCDYGLRPVYWVPCRNEPGQDLVSQLEAGEVDADEIAHIVVSHFHGDHISGLSALLDMTDAPVLTTRASLEAVRSPLRAARGIPAVMLGSDMQVQLVDELMAPGVGGIVSHDVFGDGSLQLFETPGHADGHLSAYVRTADREILLTFDAAHLQANFDLEIPSGAVVSRQAALDSLARLKTLERALGDPLIIFGHEPGQWRCVDPTARLNRAPPRCAPDATEPI